MKKLLLLALLLTSFCLGQLGRFDVPGTNITVHLNDLVIVAVVSGWLFWRRRKAWKFIVEDRLWRPVFFVIATMILSLVVNAFRFQPLEIGTASLYLVRWVFFAGFFFFLKMEFSEEKVLLRRGLVLAGVVVAVTGILQYLILPNTVFLAASGWDDHFFRLIGVFFDPGFTGAILVILLAVTFLTRRSFTGNASAALIYSALALTYSRASYLMYVVVFAFLAYFQKSTRIFLLAVILLGITIFVLPQHPGEGTKLTRDNSIFARIKNWRQSAAIWTTAPVFGVGFNTYRYTQRNLGLLSVDEAKESHAGAGADSSVLLVLATTGIVGFTAFMFFLHSVWKESRGDLLLKITLPAILIGSFFNNLLFYAWAMELIWLLLASREDNGQSQNIKSKHQE